MIHMIRAVVAALVPALRLGREFQRIVALLLVLSGARSVRAQDWVRANFSALPPPVSETSGRRGGETATGGVHDASPGLNGAREKVGRTANLGGLALSLSGEGSIEYSDNVRVEREGREGVTATAGLRFDASYQLTRLQDLSLQGMVSNRVPLLGPGRREQLFSVAPDSALRFNVWVKSLRLSPFVKYRRQLDPVLSPVVNQTEILDQAAFTTGVQADLPLHEAGVQVLAFRERRSQKGDLALAQTSWSQVGGFRFFRRLSAAHELTADVTSSATHYVGGPSQRSEAWSFGLFDNWHLTKLANLQAGTGFSRNRYHDPKVDGDTTRNSSPFYSVSFDHQPRENLSYTVRYQRSIQEGVSTNFFRLHEIALTPRYRLAERLTFESAVGWQGIRESGPIGERATRWNFSLAVSPQFTVHFSGRLAVERVVKTSTLAAREYRQNRVVLSLSQEF